MVLSVESLFKLPCEFFFGGCEQFPKKSLPEFAFLGRSNVGKSSLLNALTYRNNLARTSKTPGRTQNLNFFNLGNILTLVDMPGYGYAKASKSTRKEFLGGIKLYLETRSQLRCLFLLIDSRRDFMTIDQDVLNFLNQMSIPTQIIFTKCDLYQRKDHLSVSVRSNKGIHALRSWIYHHL